MAQAASRLEEVIRQFRQPLFAHAAAAQSRDQQGARAQGAGNGGYGQGVDGRVGFDYAAELRGVSASARFVEQRCPVCAGFGCGGC